MSIDAAKARKIAHDVVGMHIKHAAPDGHKGLATKSDFHKAMKAHGVVKGDGNNKRHPATSHYKGQDVAHARYGK